MYNLNLVISIKQTIYDALALIDINKKGFLIVIDNDKKVVGTITDGDIRREVLKGTSTETCLTNVVKSDFKKLIIEDSSIGDAIDIFKSKKINFLPIVDKNNVLINIISKRQLHSMLLLDVQGDLEYDFSSLDENVVDYEIFSRPWGFYKTTVMNQYFQSKIITVKPKAQLSLQSHERREEHWIITSGHGKVQIDNSVFEVRCGNSVFIPKGAKHRLANIDEHESLIVTEVQIGDYFGEDDIRRYEDDYGRI